jgi:hypothetical protein
VSSVLEIDVNPIFECPERHYLVVIQIANVSMVQTGELINEHDYQKLTLGDPYPSWPASCLFSLIPF